MSSSLPYRPSVGIMLLNAANKVFVGERIDSPGAWQMPQGGADPGEDTKTTFMRELYEEIGTNNATILLIADKKLYYDFPPELGAKLWNGKYRGQEQTWIAARFNGVDSEINLNAHTPPEFGRWQWVKMDDMINLIVPFKRDVYREVVGMFQDLKNDP